MKPELLKDATYDTVLMISDSGFINKVFFVEWPKDFAKYARPTEDDPVLLTVDSHMTHCSLEAVTFCRQNYITLLSLLPHPSHNLQPLDRGFFGSLKMVYAAEFGKWMHNQPRLGSPQSDICRIFRKV